ncbi:MAG: endonuclease/exonuclease/phosphatase family protein [Chloroflexi bacterium]|nr:endonuclease/exonuclease/phosphatase family protein [Chloroflexota bacterium]
MVRWIANAISLLASAGLVVIDLFVLLHITVNERVEWIAASNNVAVWVLLAAIPLLLLILAIPIGRRWRALLALPALVALLISQGPLFLPDGAILASEVRFTVASFNATAQQDVPEQAPLRAQAMLSTGADILGIQEFDFPPRYIPLLEETYPYYFTPSDLIGTGHDMPYALFSKYPIDPSEVEVIAERPDRQRPVAARFVVTIETQPISVYVMHTVKPDIALIPPWYDAWERRAGTLDVVARVGEDDNPVIVLCDCNMSDQTADYARMAELLADSWFERGSGFGFTVPAVSFRAPFPFMRVDYIWHSDGVQTESIHVGQDNGGSDHFPVIAQMSLLSAD